MKCCVLNLFFKLTKGCPKIEMNCSPGREGVLVHQICWLGSIVKKMGDEKKKCVEIIVENEKIENGD